MQIIVSRTRQWPKQFADTFHPLVMALEQISAALPALSPGNSKALHESVAALPALSVGSIKTLHTRAKSAIKSTLPKIEKIQRPDERQTKGSFRSWCAPLANLAQFGVPPGVQYSGAGSIFPVLGSQYSSVEIIL